MLKKVKLDVVLSIALSLLIAFAIQFWFLPPLPANPGISENHTPSPDGDIEAEFPGIGFAGQEIRGVIRIRYREANQSQGGNTSIEVEGKAVSVTSIRTVKTTSIYEEWQIGLRPAGGGRVQAKFRVIERGNVTYVALPEIIVAATFADRLIVTGTIALILFTIISSLVGALLNRRSKAAQIEKKIEQAEIKAEEQPDKAKYAWDLARVKLEAYFDRNLLQVNTVFTVAVVVMCVGFGSVVVGAFLSYHEPQITPASMVAGISGIITQFIGATFMVIYRSTMTQANQFMAVLERINTVGMAIQVLDSIPDSETKLKNETRTQIIALLLNSNVKSTTKTRKTHAPGT